MTLRSLTRAVRALLRVPAFTLATVLLVGVGAGSVTGVATLINHVLLRPLPYPSPEELVMVDGEPLTGPAFRRLGTAGAVRTWAAAWAGDATLLGTQEPLRVRRALVTEDFFGVFGAQAEVGRLFDESDFQASNVVVLSHDAWLRYWGGAPTVVGSTLVLDSMPVTVVGILSDAFAPPEAVVGSGVELWKPVDWQSTAMTSEDYHVLTVIGRRATGSSLQAVRLELSRVLPGGGRSPPHGGEAGHEGGSAGAAVSELSDVTVQDARAGLGLLLGAVSLLLVVAIANLASLFLARGLDRRRELAVRRALGGSVPRLVGQLLGEAVVLGLGGAILGSLVAWGGLTAFAAMNPVPLPRQAGVELDATALFTLVVLAFGITIVCGVLPSLNLPGRRLAPALNETSVSAGSTRWVAWARKGLVVLEIGLAFVLATGAGLLSRSFLLVRSQDPGFRTSSVWTVPLNPPEPPTQEELVEQASRILEAVRQVPGVEAASYGATAPMEITGGARCCWRTRLDNAERGITGLNAVVHPIDQGYFDALEIPVPVGEVWSKDDVTSNPVRIVVNESLARAMFGGPDEALGRTFSMSRLSLRVVGISPDTRHFGLDQEHGPAVYFPFERMPFVDPRLHIVVRVGDAVPASVPLALRTAVQSAIPGLPVPTVRDMESWISMSQSNRRFDSVLSGAFASASLILAVCGLYGVLLHLAVRRRREMGIRWALGATRRDIERRMLGQGARLGIAGVALGAAGGWAVMRGLRSRMWGVAVGDLATWVAVAVVLITFSVLASWLPAVRAGRLDPVDVLRAE